MTRYRRVETGTFFDSNVRELSRPGPNGRDLWMYLLCGPRTTIFPGVIVATEAVIADDLGWPVGSHDPFTGQCRCLRDAWNEIASRDMAQADWKAGLVVLPRALLDRSAVPRESSRPTSPNAFKGWAKSWSEIPDCRLKDEYLLQLGEFAKALDELTRTERVQRRGSAAQKRDPYGVSPYHDAYLNSFRTRIERAMDACRTRPGPRRDPDPDPDPDPDLRSGSDPDRNVHIDPHVHQALGPDRDLPGDPLPAVPVRPVIATAPIAQPSSSWKQRQAWWGLMLDADARIRVQGIEPMAPQLGKTCAGIHEDNMAKCVKNLVASGNSPEEVDAKMRHLVEVREREAIKFNHRKWFKPSVIWDPVNAARGFDTSLDEASGLAEGHRKPPTSSRFGRVEPHAASEYPDGEIPPEIAFGGGK